MTHSSVSAFLFSPRSIQTRGRSRSNNARVARSKRLALRGIGVLAILALASTTPTNVATAATATATMGVSASVTATCVVATTNMAFGAYSGVALPGTATVTTTCTSSTPYTIGLSAGAGTGPAATVTSRHMMGTGAAILNYALTQDAAHATNWGNTPATDTPASALGTGVGVPVTVYGLIPAGQYPAPNAAYADTITVTVNF